MYEGKIKLIEYQGRELRFLNQRSRNWTHPYPYGENDDSTLSSAGCGIFSIAHVVELSLIHISTARCAPRG